jgi:hypothetical protein
MFIFFKKIAYILVPIAAIMAMINYTVDPQSQFHDYRVKSMAQSLRVKKEIEIRKEYDYRSFQKHAIALMKERPDIVLMGTSRAMTIGGEFFKDKVFFNSCQPRCTLKDMIAILDLYEKRGLMPRTVIMEIVPVFFSRSSKNDRWLTLYDEYYEGLSKMYSDDKTATAGIILSRYLFGISKYYKWRYLFDPAYLKLSLKDMADSLKMVLRERFAPGEKYNDAEAYRMLHFDGSMSHSWLDENKESGAADEEARAIVNSLSQMRSGDASIKKDFEVFLSYLKRSGVETVILLLPVNQLTFDAANSRYGGIIISSENEVRTMAKDHGFKVIGTYDPRRYGLKNTDFVDGIHPKEYVYGRMVKDSQGQGR